MKTKPPPFKWRTAKKRIAIAGIIAMKPELMILDEPTAGLDPDGVEKVLKYHESA